ncbi:MAG: hypothetical protein HQM01_06105 [Magnetococcales bacterium]|nr:hypothetical protein [Magnetococcales bacterium]
MLPWDILCKTSKSKSIILLLLVVTLTPLADVLIEYLNITLEKVSIFKRIKVDIPYNFIVLYFGSLCFLIGVLWTNIRCPYYIRITSEERNSMGSVMYYQILANFLSEGHKDIEQLEFLSNNEKEIFCKAIEYNLGAESRTETAIAITFINDNNLTGLFQIIYIYQPSRNGVEYLYMLYNIANVTDRFIISCIYYASTVMLSVGLIKGVIIMIF